MVVKGALAAVLGVCSHAEARGGIVPVAEVDESIRQLQAALEQRGLRTLGVAIRHLPLGTTAIGRDDENDLTFLGVLVLRDPQKAGAELAVTALARLGVSFKMITGDSAAVARTDRATGGNGGPGRDHRRRPSNPR
jgi:P-type Mg2+ transporter